MGSINVCKYQDHNGNGSWNPGDAGIQGWEMTAYNTTTDKTYTMLTASDGCALFTDLPYGIYDVSEEVRDGWIKTSPSSSDPRRIWITASNSINGIGYYNFQLGTISGQKFNDINNNGVKDPGEIGLAGWTINLDLNADSSVEQTAVTDVDGNYTFTNLVAGTYRVREQAQDGWAQTTTNPQDITIQSGSVVAGIDFGNVQMGKIIIEKQTIPDGSTQSFEFTPSYSEKFSLTDGNTNDSGYLLPGTYSISETAMEDWDLTNVVCDDGSSIDAISISPNETVTCTFTNTQRGKITVIKKTEGDTGKTFPFVTDFAGTFNLGQNGVWTSGFLLPGKTYTVFEGNLYHSHWYFDKLECVDSTQQANIVQFKDTANISLNPGSDVICTFYNSYSQDDSNGGGGGNGGGGANNAGGGIAGILGTGGGGGGNATTGGGSVEGASTEGGEQPTTGGNEGGQVLGVEAQQCASWPLWAWILLLIAFAGIFNFAVWNLYKEIKTIKWFWPLVWMIGGLGVWYFYDGCRTFMWFPYVTVILAAISYILYIYKMKQISK